MGLGERYCAKFPAGLPHTHFARKIITKYYKNELSYRLA